MNFFRVSENNTLHWENQSNERRRISFFGNEAILQVDAPLAEGQLVETAFLNIVNYQTLIATKSREN
ncbi:hypothetical protein GCM10020331_056170 [Ectobacillus funiculus]